MAISNYAYGGSGDYIYVTANSSFVPWTQEYHILTNTDPWVTVDLCSKKSKERDWDEKENVHVRRN